MDNRTELTAEDEKRIRDFYAQQKCPRGAARACPCTVCTANRLLAEIDHLRVEKESILQENYSALVDLKAEVQSKSEEVERMKQRQLDDLVEFGLMETRATRAEQQIAQLQRELAAKHECESLRCPYEMKLKESEQQIERLRSLLSEVLPYFHTGGDTYRRLLQEQIEEALKPDSDLQEGE
jgi:hypothetical protein